MSISSKTNEFRCTRASSGERFALAKIQIPVPPSGPSGVGKPKEPTILERVKAQRAKGPTDPDTKNSRWKIEPLDYAAEVGADDTWPWRISPSSIAHLRKSAFAHMHAFWGWATKATERGGADFFVGYVFLGRTGRQNTLNINSTGKSHVAKHQRPATSDLCAWLKSAPTTTGHVSVVCFDSSSSR